jgi:mono/diheme cytochrome c family protein
MGLGHRLGQVVLLSLLAMRAWRRRLVRRGERPAVRPAASRRDPVRPGVLRRHWILVTAIILALVALPLGALGFIYSGVYNVAATRQHTAPVYWALIKTLRQSVLARAAREVGPVPDLTAPGRAEQGLALFEANCVPCHGGPGVAMHDIGKGLTPAPANLVITGREWSSQEIFWSVKHGFKMTGMPAWAYRLSDDEIWSIVALVKTLPTLSPAEYRERRAPVAAALSGEDGGEP